MSERPNARDRALAALTPPPAEGSPAGSFLDGTAGIRPTRFIAGVLFAGRYRMVAPLSIRSGGEIWRADDLILQTPVALKLLPDSDTGARGRILDEVRLARQITHPAVCRVFDVGEADGCLFYSMELVDGDSLATLLRRAGRVPIERAVDLAAQICDALAAAHAGGVVHGHLTPATVLVDGDGFVRVTDFGVGSTDASEDQERPYRAPEQAKTDVPSERGDVYAVGVILYELIVGHRPVREAGTRSRRLPKPSALVGEVNTRLDRAVLDALAADPRARPGSASTLAERLRASLAPPQPRTSKGWSVVAAVIAVAVVAALASYLSRGTPAPLSSRDTMLIADFANTTGEPIFDGALKVALAVALEQSPFLKVFPDERIRETLQLMERSPDERVTRSLGREIARREQLKALVAGSIAKLGSHYVLTLEAVNAQSGDVIAREQVEVPDSEGVLGALGSSASKLRERLGESLASIRQFDAPLPRATTASLEALHAYSLALDDGRMNLRVEAIPHLQRAIELDPQFALAQAMLSGVYANTGRTSEAPAFARRAFELRDRVSERERFFISWRYYIDSAQAWDDALDLAASWARTYPREPFAFNSLGLASAAFGQHESAVGAFRTALQLDARFLPPNGNLVGSLIALGRYDEAQRALRDARAQGIEATSLHRAAYVLALIAGDDAGAAAALDAARRSSSSALTAINWEAHRAAFEGRVQEAHTLFTRAVEEAAAANARELAAQWRSEDAEMHGLAGQCDAARTETSGALALSRDNFTLERVARTLAGCGAQTEADAIRQELALRFPDATLTRQIQLPVIEASLALRAQPARAIDRLETVRPYDNAPSAEFWPSYLRGMAYLEMKDGRRAADEFQRILTHRGEAPMSMLYALSRLGTARAARLLGDRDTARREFDAFFRGWQEADASLPPLRDARREYEALR